MKNQKVKEDIMNCIETGILNERYKVVTVNGKIDYVEAINISNSYKSQHKRCDLSKNKQEFERILYAVAKQQPQIFEALYNELKENDREFFVSASRVLRKIHNEYAFN